ncbi:MAG: SCO6745 family protein [Mycobacteriales bacterium]
MDSVVARRAWQRVEPLHAVTYFAPETRAATDALGLRGGWMSYFGCRAAPLGPVPAAVVTALFYGFHPAMVARAIPDAWRAASPERLLAARVAAVDAAYRRMLGEGEDGVGGPTVREAAVLAAAAVSAVSVAGRALAAANAALTPPTEPHLALWQAVTVLREHRGDGHVTALVAAGVEPCQSQVMAAAAGRAPAGVLRQNRRWSEDEWAEAVDALAVRGWVTTGGELTSAGRSARREIEEHTDRLAFGPYEALGGRRCDQLLAALHRLAQRVVDAGGVPWPNPIGVPWPPTDEVS